MRVTATTHFCCLWLWVTLQECRAFVGFGGSWSQILSSQHVPSVQRRQQPTSFVNQGQPPGLPGFEFRLSAASHALPLNGINLLLSWIGNLWQPFFSKPMVRLMALLLTFLTSVYLYRHRYQYLWPGLQSDPDFSEPLPQGSVGCPWFGNNILLANNEKLGPEYYYRQNSRRLGDPRIWKSYFMGRPIAIVSGADFVKEVNNLEFTKTGAGSTVYDNREKKERPRVFGTDNLNFERKKERHVFLRRLVGSAMTPLALKDALPTIVDTANQVIDQCMTNSTVIKMEDVCVDYTLNIVQNQLLGLRLQQEEASHFRDRLKDWIKGFFSLVDILGISYLIKRSKPYQAKLYIQARVGDKIDSLLKEGPDTSTLSKMLFAVDEENESKLSREEVVDNALLLIIAGSETSAGSMTLAFMLLGLHPDRYQKLVQEQRDVVDKFGEQLTPCILDQECPFLEAVVKEALRMGPVTGGFPRRVQETFVVDGAQVPKGWGVFTTYRLTHQLDPVTSLPDDAHMNVYAGFQPERWLDPETTPSDYIPFGAGPRFCLGYHLAMMEMKVFLATFARKVAAFELTNYPVGSKRTVKWNPYTIMPRPKDGVLVQSVVRST